MLHYKNYRWKWSSKSFSSPLSLRVLQHSFRLQGVYHSDVLSGDMTVDFSSSSHRLIEPDGFSRACSSCRWPRWQSRFSHFSMSALQNQYQYSTASSRHNTPMLFSSIPRYLVLKHLHASRIRRQTCCHDWLQHFWIQHGSPSFFPLSPLAIRHALKIETILWFCREKRIRIFVRRILQSKTFRDFYLPQGWSRGEGLGGGVQEDGEGGRGTTWCQGCWNDVQHWEDWCNRKLNIRTPVEPEWTWDRAEFSGLVELLCQDIMK